MKNVLWEANLRQTIVEHDIAEEKVVMAEDHGRFESGGVDGGLRTNLDSHVSSCQCHVFQAVEITCLKLSKVTCFTTSSFSISAMRSALETMNPEESF